ncbi:MAG: hypothetical protein KJ630_14685 [Proteobacteria bacterium]|nr:hypothetical protein [Pseudomonadota bacterium]
MENTKKKGMIFRIDQETGGQFTATAELLGIEKNELLQQLMEEFITRTKESIVDVAHKYPKFSHQYPFLTSEQFLQ